VPKVTKVYPQDIEVLKETKVVKVVKVVGEDKVI